MPPTHTGTGVPGHIVHGEGVGQAANPARLDVDVATGADTQRLLGGARIDDALVETEYACAKDR